MRRVTTTRLNDNSKSKSKNNSVIESKPNDKSVSKSKNNSVSESKNGLVLEETNSLREIANEVFNRTSNAIEKGINNSKASNGTDMEKLHGAARTTATLKNIGKQTNENGGMIEGVKTIKLNGQASGIINTLDYIKNINTIQKNLDGNK